MSRLRVLPLLSLLAAVSAVLPARAESTTLTFTDPRGDWQVPSQDIVQVTLHSVAEQGEHLVEADLTLADAPGPLYTSYVVAFQAGQTCYALATSTVNGQPTQASGGSASASPSSLSAVPCADAGAQPIGASATSTVHGSTVAIRALYALGLHPGQRLSAITVAVGTQPTESGASVGNKNVTTTTGDFAWTKRTLQLR